MSLLHALLNVIVPVVLVAGTGTILARRFTLDAGTISKISINGLTPALALQTLLTTQVSGGDLGMAVLSYTLLTLLAVVLGLVLTPGLAAPQRRAVMASASTANAGNMGLPIALFALGQVGFEHSVMLFMTSVVLTFIVLPVVYGASSGFRSAVMAIVKLPVMWAMAFAIIWRLLGWELPSGVMSGIELLSQATLPMVLLALGIQLGSTGRPRFTRAVGTAVVLRVLVMPAAALGVGLLLGLHGVLLQALVLAMSMPTAVNAYLLSVEFDSDVRTVGDTVTISTVVSFVTIALVTLTLPWIGTL